MAMGCLLACDASDSPVAAGRSATPLYACQRGAPDIPTDPCDVYGIGCGGGESPPNVLLVIGDDVGIDLVRGYAANGDAPPTPTLDRLAHEGVRFTHAYSMPWCSPTRAGILTGRFGYRFGLGRAIPLFNPADVSLPLAELTIPELLDSASPWRWQHALIGKWHLTRFGHEPATAPLRHGFHRFLGTVGNLSRTHSFRRRDQGYYDWERVVDGSMAPSTTYSTTRLVDDALAVIHSAVSPWFVWLAFHAAHEPHAPPPVGLHSYGDLSGAPPDLLYRAEVEAMDRELGRLLDRLGEGVRERTMVIFVGDNGTSPEGQRGPWRGAEAKGTVYEAGVRVPLIVAGPLVGGVGRESHALVHTNDLFETILDIAGVPCSDRPEAVDSVSLLPLALVPGAASTRDVVASESFDPNGPGPYRVHMRMVRDERYKLVRRMGAPDEFYDLQGRLVEGETIRPEDLDADARAARARLEVRLAEIFPP
jgi:arylsulfatase A-like enzyme